MTRSFALLLSMLLASATIAHADTLTTFQIQNGALDSGEQVNGTVVVDTTTGTVVSENVMTTVAGKAYDFTTLNFQELTNHDYFWDFTDGTADGDIFQLSVPLPGLVGYVGSSLCSESAYCYDAANNTNYNGAFIPPSGNDDFLASGNLAITPEPSSLLLLGTGAMGILGVAYRRPKRAISA